MRSPAIGLALCAAVLLAQTREAPSYSTASIVNAASSEAGPFAPYSLITIYGKNLSYVTQSIQAFDMRGLTLPSTLLNTGVRVTIGNLPAAILYVSPTQINALIPVNAPSRFADVQVGLDALYGLPARVAIADSAPELFLSSPDTPIAVRLDGRLATKDDPARAGEWVTLYATGLGRTVPQPFGLQIASGPARLERFADFEVLLDGRPVAGSNIGYAGLAPGFGGLYQINVKLPDDAPADPELRLGLRDGAKSRAGLRLPLRR